MALPVLSRYLLLLLETNVLVYIVIIVVPRFLKKNMINVINAIPGAFSINEEEVNIFLESKLSDYRTCNHLNHGKPTTTI